MTEKEKMLTGQPYLASDPQLVQEREVAHRLLHRLNVIDYQASEQILRSLLPNASADIEIVAPFYCDYGYNIYCGEKVYFNFNCVILDDMPIRIGSNVLFAPGVHIYTASHPLESEVRKSGLEFSKPVVIGDNCWFGGGSIVLPGVTIGDNCVIGAGSVVTKDIPSDTNVVGNPARTITR